MTFYGIDISEWQNGLSLKKAEEELSLIHI